jgi:hypothetical protein
MIAIALLIYKLAESVGLATLIPFEVGLSHHHCPLASLAIVVIFSAFSSKLDNAAKTTTPRWGHC